MFEFSWNDREIRAEDVTLTEDEAIIQFGDEILHIPLSDYLQAIAGSLNG